MWLLSPFKSRSVVTSRRRSSRPRLQSLEHRLQPSTGVLDPTFGSGGQLTSAITSNAVIVQSWDSKIVIAGGSGSTMALARYNTNGSLDTTYDGDGKLVSNISGSIAAAAQYPQAGNSNDGKVVGAGGTSLVRFNANGGVDTTFGKQGKATLPWTGTIGNVVIQGDGKVVVSGLEGTSSNRTIKMTRFNTNGSVDNSFGTKGTWQISAVVYVSPPPIIRAPLTIQPDGKLLVGRPYGWLTPGYGWMTYRLTTSGTIDTTYTVTTTTFGTAWNQPNGAARPTGLAVYPESDATNAGKILAVGYTHQVSGGPPGGATVLARYNSNGTFDSSFGAGGKVITPTSGAGIPYGVAIQSDGKAVLVGSSMQRYNTDGTLDTSFGNGGFVPTFYSGVGIQPDGRIDVSNSTTLARYLGSQPQIGSLTADPNPVTTGSDVTLTASNITSGNPNSAISQVRMYYIDGSGTQQTLGYGTQASPGVWSLTFAVGLAPGQYTIYAEAEDNFGVVGDPVVLDVTVI